MAIIRVNLSTGEIKKDHAYPECWGRELIVKVLAKEVNPKCHPLDPENKLIIAGGPLAGAGVSSCGRLSVGGKSPLTGGVKEANAGGTAATYLAKWGIRGIILEGEARTLCTLIIGEDIALVPSQECCHGVMGDLLFSASAFNGELGVVGKNDQSCSKHKL